MQKITPFLWFDTEGEDAARFYTSVFPNSRIVEIQRYGEAGPRPDGTVMTVAFELDGQRFVALNGGPEYIFNEAISLAVECEDQDEVDRYWDALIAAGAKPIQCGWIEDPFGLAWQIVPRRFMELIRDNDATKVQAVMAAMLKMVKLDVAALERAYAEA